MKPRKEEYMRKNISLSNIVVVGLVRNCEKNLEIEVQKINSAFVSAASIRWLVIESDSDDGTVNILKKLSVNSLFNFISLGKLETKHPMRTERIAKCRNRYLEELRVKSKYNKIDYVVVADLDGINSKLTSSAVNSCWDLGEDWDACFANQSEAYYDIWALRHRVWSPNDCWENYDFLINNGKSKSEALKTAVYSRMIKLKNNMKPLEVDSAFGGLGIYKSSIFLESKYTGLNLNQEEICEHVNFHNGLREKGFRLFIAPALINCGWNEHNKNLKIKNRITSILRHSLVSLARSFISRYVNRNLR